MGKTTLKEKQHAVFLIYSNEIELVKQQQIIFDTLWQKAIPAKQRIKEIEEGIEPEFLDTIREPEEIQNLIFKIIDSAKFEILALLSPSSFSKEIVSKIIAKTTNNDKIKSQILLPNEDKLYEDSNIIRNFQNNTFIRNLRQELKTTVSILLIDKKYFLSIELNDTLNNFSDAIGLTIYSNNHPLVSTYISIFNTLWQQVDLYDKIYQIYESLKARDKAQLEFLNVTAHELRNPLQPIIGLIGILSSGNIAVESHDEMLNVIGRNAKKLQRLSEDILDVAKIENDSLKLNKEVFDLNGFILSIIGDFAEESRKENTKIVINQNINRDNLKERVFVKADKNRIGQVISNLLSNALKFTKEWNYRYIHYKKCDS